ncbi:MAG TPA: MaoC/PaaZ C-terminal domain-containing protein [Solirubrobacterales bacterium]|jgi:acyl dehydratase|nr:MaoC/PaaZ C-terminal domain-containing protein [Solirubrobacterales bacterium]
MATETRRLTSAPSILPLYARAALPLVPGASHLPFVPGGGGEIPAVRLELDGVVADPAAVAAYAKVCGFALRDHLPPTYPHVLAFPLHMALMSDGSFPFGAVGLVHVANKITQHRRLGGEEELALRVEATKLVAHPKGRAFDVVTEVRVGRQIAWESISTFLRRGKSDTGAASGEAFPIVGDEVAASAEWRLPGDLGRRYAAVSGDRNPIHMHALTAKPLGFPAAIAHGMWTKARALAALESRLPDAFETDVRFRRPILLPARVEFATVDQETQQGQEEIDFTVRGRGDKRSNRHLDGRVRPVAAKSRAGTANSKTAKAKTKTGKAQ